MGGWNSRPEEDKGLQLCRARKKFIKQLLIGRCSLASAHTAYVDHLRAVGSTLGQFVNPDTIAQAFPSIPSSAIPNHHALVEKPISVPSQSLPSHFQSNATKYRGSTFSRKVEEMPPVLATVTCTEASEATLPWDYFGIFHHSDEQFSVQEQTGLDSEDDEGMPELEDIEEDESRASGDEFEEPSPALLVRSFRNINTIENVVPETRDAEQDVTKEEKSLDPWSHEYLSLRDNVENAVHEGGVVEDVIQPASRT